jgi:uncharacterized protein (DUF433 family)
VKQKKKNPAKQGTPAANPAENVSSRVREEPADGADDYHAVITVEPGKRGGRACIRGMRITVGDVLGWLAAGMSEKEVLREHPELTSEDIRASLAYAADRENKAQTSWFTEKWADKFKLPKPDPSDPRLTYLLERYERNR